MARPTTVPTPPDALATSDTSKRKSRKPKRWKSGTVVLRNIRRLQKSTEPLIPRSVINAILRQELTTLGGGLRASARVPDVLREAAEAFMVERLRYSNFVAVSRDSQTLQVRDMRVAQAIENKELN